MNAVEYIESRIERIPFSGCWIWMRAVNSRGYGSMVFDKRAWTAHRFSYATFVGPIADGMFVCHACDVQACVNPAHLFLGTPWDNADDMTKKGRRKDTPPGPWRARSCRSPETVQAMLDGIALGLSDAEVARRVGVRFQSVWLLRHGKSYKYAVEGKS